MDFFQFQKFRDKWIVEHPDGLDAGQTNLYHALASADPSQFGPLNQHAYPDGAYRCHVAEAFLRHAQWPAQWSGRSGVSRGVRDSLRILFSELAHEGPIGIPSDVYPVYGQLAQEAQVEQIPYAAREGLPWDRMNNCRIWLICDPLKPWGGSLEMHEAERLLAWVRSDRKRMVVIDSAYQFPVSPACRYLLDNDGAAVLVSLSKGWLLPGFAGLGVFPAHWASRLRAAFARQPKHIEKLTTAYCALTDYAQRPMQVSHFLQTQASRWDAIKRVNPQWKATPTSAYFFSSSRSWDYFLDKDVLAIPSGIFGSTWEGCVLSTLSQP